MSNDVAPKSRLAMLRTNLATLSAACQLAFADAFEKPFGEKFDGFIGKSSENAERSTISVTNNRRPLRRCAPSLGNLQ